MSSSWAVLVRSLASLSTKVVIVMQSPDYRRHETLSHKERGAWDMPKKHARNAAAWGTIDTVQASLRLRLPWPFCDAGEDVTAVPLLVSFLFLCIENPLQFKVKGQQRPKSIAMHEFSDVHRCDLLCAVMWCTEMSKHNCTTQACEERLLVVRPTGAIAPFRKQRAKGRDTCMAASQKLTATVLHKP